MSAFTPSFVPPNVRRQRAKRSAAAWLRYFAGWSALWIIPLLIAMAFPVIKSGEIMFKGGLMVFGACSCCDGGGGGGGCCTGNCTHCDTGSATVWALTISGGACDGHCEVAGSNSNIITGSAAGTYTLTTVGACSWAKSAITSPPAIGTVYSDTVCGSVLASSTEMSIGMVQQAGSTLSVTVSLDNPFVGALVIESPSNASAATTVCCSTVRSWSGTTSAICGGSSVSFVASTCP